MGQPFDQKILEELIEEVDEDKSGELNEFFQLNKIFTIKFIFAKRSVGV